MIKKYLLKKFVGWYLGRLEKIMKLSPEEEMKLYRFRTSEDTYKVLKTALTAQIMWHFEAETEYEKTLAKGAALNLKALLDANRYADKIAAIEDEDKRFKEWKNFKKVKRIN